MKVDFDQKKIRQTRIKLERQIVNYRTNLKIDGVFFKPCCFISIFINRMATICYG